MSTNPIEDNTTPKATGSLEELFRHHLGEDAAVPTRPMVWDHIDNSLLIRQNEIFRRRLVVTRWVAAASLLLATLAGTGWWAGRSALLGGSGTVATVSSPATGAGASTMAARTADGRPTNQPNGLSAATGQASSVTASAGTTATGTLAAANQAAAAHVNNGIANPRNSEAYAAQGTLAANAAPRNFNRETAVDRRGTVRQALAPNSISSEASNSLATNASNTESTGAEGQSLAARTTQAATAMPNGIQGTGSPTTAALAANETAVSTSTTSSVLAANSPLNTAGASAAASALATTDVVAADAASAQVGLLATRPAALSLADAATLPNGLATVPLAETPTVAVASKWRYSATYAVGAFNPNINFSRAGIEAEHDYNPALGPDSPKLTEAAAAQYREHLRPGLSQRIALLATRHLGGHWSLSTGLELSQATAKSASTASFVGEQLYDLGAQTNGQLRTTDFRYRMASIPVEVRYANPAKKGWSLYGRLGGVMSALLGVRSEVEGDPEATKTYSILSAGMPYRRVLGSVRGGAGAQYRPSVGNWAFTLGPVAEISAVSLNAHPVQDFLHQSRAYGFGIEAGVEFGR